MSVKVVLGAGFGDEGKGSVTAYLVSRSIRPLVVRFNGGHQAGHTVVQGDKHHVFSSFGSGTLKGVPTFWSKYCTVEPTGLLNEYYTLKTKGVNPILYIDPLCPITTPYDIEHNRRRERLHQHGSVGLGFGTTIQRQESTDKLYLKDIFNDTVFKYKLRRVGEFHGFKPEYGISGMRRFMDSIHELKSSDWFKVEVPNFKNYVDIVFEGAQGILLDQDHGFFPHVTRSYTTSRNAMEIIKEFNLSEPEIHYVTRSYQTRHGNGPMTNENLVLDLVNTENETNVEDEYQGIFRKSILDVDLLKYAIESDRAVNGRYSSVLNITCLDQTGETFKGTINGEIHELTDFLLGDLVYVPRIHPSFSAEFGKLTV